VIKNIGYTPSLSGLPTQAGVKSPLNFGAKNPKDDSGVNNSPSLIKKSAVLVGAVTLLSIPLLLTRLPVGSNKTLLALQGSLKDLLSNCKLFLDKVMGYSFLADGPLSKIR
jgi:hypothetical protein